MEESSRNDIRHLLKTFGLQADEAVISHLARNPDDSPLHIRLVLDDITDYGDSPPRESLHLEIEGEVRR